MSDCMQISIKQECKDDDDDDKSIMIDEHQMSISDVLARYGTVFNAVHLQQSYGLSSGDCSNRLLQFGSNQLTRTAETSSIALFLQHLLGLFNLMLIVSGLLSIVLFILDTHSMMNLFLGCFILVVAIINAAIDFFQQHQTRQLLKSFMVCDLL